MTRPPLDDTRRQLGELEVMARQTDAMERQILDRAETLLAQAQTRIDELRPKVHVDAAAAQEYEALIRERGQLRVVIAQARQHLS